VNGYGHPFAPIVGSIIYPPKRLISRGSISNSVMTEWTPEGQADQTPKSLGLRIIRRLRETFVVNENEVIISLGASEVNP
jgi:hypothetical protein